MTAAWCQGQAAAYYSYPLKVQIRQLLPFHRAGIYILIVSYFTRALPPLHRQARAQPRSCGISQACCLGAEMGLGPAKLGLSSNRKVLEQYESCQCSLRHSKRHSKKTSKIIPRENSACEAASHGKVLPRQPPSNPSHKQPNSLTPLLGRQQQACRTIYIPLSQKLGRSAHRNCQHAPVSQHLARSPWLGTFTPRHRRPSKEFTGARLWTT